MNTANTSFLIDMMSTFQTIGADDDSWSRVVALVRDFGFRDLNVAHFSGADYLPVWARVSMTEQDGHREYLDQGFIEIDPILQARHRNLLGDHARLDMPSAGRMFPENSKFEQLHRLYRDCGYHDFITLRSNSLAHKGDCMVVLMPEPGVDIAPTGQGPSPLAILSNLIAAHIRPPSAANRDGHLPELYRFLSPREQDVLCYLASGLSNDQIAYKLGLAEVTVRLHLKNARLKMGARTREQAVVLALRRGLLHL